MVCGVRNRGMKKRMDYSTITRLHLTVSVEGTDDHIHPSTLSLINYPGWPSWPNDPGRAGDNKLHSPILNRAGLSVSLVLLKLRLVSLFI